MEPEVNWLKKAVRDLVYFSFRDVALVLLDVLICPKCSSNCVMTWKGASSTL